MLHLPPKKGRNLKNKKKTASLEDNTSMGELLTKSLHENLKIFKQLVGVSHDINIRFLKLNIKNGIDVAVIYIEALCDKESINNAIIKPLVQFTPSDPHLNSNFHDLATVLCQETIIHAKVEQTSCWSLLLDALFSGDTLLLIDGLDRGVLMGTRKWADRGVPEATTEQVIQGPKESFSETLTTSVMLLRRKIKSHKLQMEYMNVGSLSKSDLMISYIAGVVNPKLVEEVRKRILRIETDALLDTNALLEFIEDSPFAVFPQLLRTERPDKAAAHLLEGGVVILLDGCPLAILLPITFWQFLYSPEDYYERLYTSFILRSLRLLSLVLALSLPSFYIAASTFHQEFIPLGLLEIIIAGRRNIPFPLMIEVFIMEFILEVIREAGVRLPQNVGQAISIVGALVLGQAAIQAKLASPATVTIVAITAIANFTIPAFSAALSIRYLRFGLLFISGFLGIFGFITAVFILLIHLCSLRSFGVPFLAPNAPAVPSDFKDTAIRMPVWMMNKRPRFFGAKDSIRQKSNQKPGADKNNKNPEGGPQND